MLSNAIRPISDSNSFNYGSQQWHRCTYLYHGFQSSCCYYNSYLLSGVTQDTSPFNDQQTNIFNDKQKNCVRSLVILQSNVSHSIPHICLSICKSNFQSFSIIHAEPLTPVASGWFLMPKALSTYGYSHGPNTVVLHCFSLYDLSIFMLVFLFCVFLSSVHHLLYPSVIFHSTFNNNLSFQSLTCLHNIFIFVRPCLNFSWVILSSNLIFKISLWHFISKAFSIFLPFSVPTFHIHIMSQRTQRHSAIAALYILSPTYIIKSAHLKTNKCKKIGVCGKLFWSVGVDVKNTSFSVWILRTPWFNFTSVSA
jgi:hypothetical protein